MELEEFKESCKNKKCLRRLRFDSKTCVRESKQINCFKSWSRLETKKTEKYKNRNELWKQEFEFLDEVWIRDAGEKKGSQASRKQWWKFCKIWKILTESERTIVMDDEEVHVAEDLDVAHIKPKSTAITEKYDLNNVVLISRLFHRRLTDLVHPVYKTPISNDDAKIWLESARDGERKI